MRKLTKLLIGVGAGISIAAGSTSIAYASGWMTFGKGFFTANTAKVQTIDVDVVLPADALLYPTASVPAKVTLYNLNNDFPVTVTKLTQLSVGVDENHELKGCSPDSVAFNPPADSALPVKLAKSSVGNGSNIKSVQATVTMAKNASLGCQNAEFTVNVKATAEVG